MNINTQSILENEKVILYPLQEMDFEALYATASDFKIWEQHPNKDRWKKEVFKTFFDGAMQSKGAFKIVDKATGNTIGSTRIYDYNEQKTAYLSAIHFMPLSIGANNIRSQVAIGRIDAEKISEQEVTYFGEAPRLNFVYEISKGKWQKIKNE